MRRSRTATALVGLLAGLLVSVAVWYYTGSIFLFLFVPFVPFLFRGRAGEGRTDPDVRTCPACGFETRDARYEFCPLDGNRLE